MRIYFTIAIILFVAPCIAQNSKIKGVITYYFNKYQGDKPDLGAKVYLIAKTSEDYNNYKVIDSFINGKFYSSLYTSYDGMAKDYEGLMKKYEKKKKYKEEYESAKKEYEDRIKYRDDYLLKLKEYRVDTREKFDSLDRRAFEALRKLIDRSLSSVTIDASGSYSISAKPADYLILIVSKNRTGLNLTDVSGKISCKDISLKEGQEKDVSLNFDIY